MFGIKKKIETAIKEVTKQKKMARIIEMDTNDYLKDLDSHEDNQQPLEDTTDRA